jgi:hypothetical protein
VNDTVRADASLQVGEAKQSITVRSQRRSASVRTNEVSQTISPAFLSELLTDGRNVIQLAALWPELLPPFRVLTPRWRKTKATRLITMASGRITMTV